MQAATMDPSEEPPSVLRGPDRAEEPPSILRDPDPAEEPPSVLWGLDPVFSAFARLFVRDILHMPESKQVPGIYFYNLHPIFKVDVLGTVVYKREREDFFCYGVDDGTGVINCLCWKRDEDEAPTTWGAPSSGGAPTGFNPAGELRQLRRAQRERRRLEIGELLRVRGPVKTGRRHREIMASTYYKVQDPLMVLQVSWMTEVLQLYREFYDLQLEQSDSTNDSLSRATEVLKTFLEQDSVRRFRPSDVQDLLQPLVCRQPQTTPAHQDLSAGPPASPPAGPPASPPAGPPASPPAGPSAGSPAGPSAGLSSGQQLRLLLREALQVLQDEGVVYRRVKSQDEVYTVTAQDKDLLMAVRDVIREDSRREKYAAKGCHVLHILSAVRQRFSLNVNRVALQTVLKSLECSSDIVSTSDSHYTAV